MRHAYNYAAPKEPTHLSINSDLLAKAKGLKLNLSATLEMALINKQSAITGSNKIKLLLRHQISLLTIMDYFQISTGHFKWLSLWFMKSKSGFKANVSLFC